MPKNCYASILLIAVSGMYGCDSGIFSSTSAANGDVLVLNRFTGEMQLVVNGRLIEVGRATASETTGLKEAAMKPSQYKTFNAVTLSQIPLRILGTSRYYDGKILLRISVRPSPEWIKSDSDMRIWRAYIKKAESSASLIVDLEDEQGFELARERVSLHSLTDIVDDSGEVFMQQGQVSIPMTQETFAEIGTWSVLWAGWPEWTGPPKPTSGG